MIPFFKKRVRKRDRGTGIYPTGDFVPRMSTPPKRNTMQLLELYGQSPRLAVIDRIASDLSGCTGRLYRALPDGRLAPLAKHPFLDFWANPNPLHEMSGEALWKLCEIYLTLKGEAYFIVEWGRGGERAELWPVPVHWVMEPPYEGHPYYTLSTPAGMMAQVEVGDMFTMKTLAPLDPYGRGLGQTESLLDEIEIDEYAAKFQKSFFYNDATPTTIITMKGASEEQQRRFRSAWNEKHNGPLQGHGVATIGNDIAVNALSGGLKDLDMAAGRLAMRNAALEHYGVPREIMGITESSNRATSEAAQYIYALNVLSPRLRRREQAINKQLLPMFGDGLVWRFDSIIPKSLEFDKQKAIEGWNAGLLTKNEARAMLDMNPIPDGDTYNASLTVEKGELKSTM